MLMYVYLLFAALAFFAAYRFHVDRRRPTLRNFLVILGVLLLATFVNAAV